MAKPIQAWTQYGPRLDPANPVTPDEIIERLVKTTNQTRGSILAVLSELDEIIQEGLQHGRVVRLPNGTHYQPEGKKDGKVRIYVRLNPRLTKQINGDFRGAWVNGENIGKSEAEIIALWNRDHPADPIP